MFTKGRLLLLLLRMPAIPLNGLFSDIDIEYRGALLPGYTNVYVRRRSECRVYTLQGDNDYPTCLQLTLLYMQLLSNVK